MKLLFIIINIFSCFVLSAQSITFNVDNVEPASKSIGLKTSGNNIAKSINPRFSDDLLSLCEPDIKVNSFADDDNLYDIGEDVLFKMLFKAWCQHRPITLTPDAVWMVISQGFSHYVNQHPEEMRSYLVNHKGRKVLRVKTDNLLPPHADWKPLIEKFTSEIDKYTNNNIAKTLVADFSTTGVNERIASEITLMDVAKPYFKYELFYSICGIPSITLTGVPEDWKMLLEKTEALKDFGLEWWIKDLKPILEEFIKASEGNPNIPFWKNIVKKGRPQTVKGPTCSRKKTKLTKFDGWFIKLFPFDNKGRTPSKVNITQTVLPETVCIPLIYDIITPNGITVNSYNFEIVAGIVGVNEDPVTFNMTPKIGWFVRSIKSN